MDDATRAGVAAFDFDGTIISGDSFLPFLCRVAGTAAVARGFFTRAPAMARAYRRRGRDGLKAVLVKECLQGVSVQDLVRLGRDYGEELAVKARPEMLERFEWHRARGHRLLLVSASLEVYLAAAGACLGFDAVLATRLAVGDDDRMTGCLNGPNVRGPEKAARLQEWLASNVGGQAYELWAYGDSDGDRQMLAMADHVVRV